MENKIIEMVGIILVINFIFAMIVILKMLVKERRKSKVEANKFADEFARFLDKYPECKNLNEINEKLRVEQTERLNRVMMENLKIGKSIDAYSKQQSIQYLTEQQNKLIEASRVLNKKIQELNNQENEQNQKQFVFHVTRPILRTSNEIIPTGTCTFTLSPTA